MLRHGGDGHRHHQFAPPPADAARPEQEERHVAADRGGDLGQQRPIIHAPESGDGHQRAGGIGTAPAKATAGRDALGQVDGDGRLATQARGQAGDRLHDQVPPVGRQRRIVAGEREAFRRRDRQHVGQANGHHPGEERVEPVRPGAADPQVQVDLGGGEEGVRGVHGLECGRGDSGVKHRTSAHDCRLRQGWIDVHVVAVPSTQPIRSERPSPSTRLGDADIDRVCDARIVTGDHLHAPRINPVPAHPWRDLDHHTVSISLRLTRNGI